MLHPNYSLFARVAEKAIKNLI
ncbi:hypothetical protein TSAR_013527 [Trichomalopsis sarcophagae]|uniref:Uncharacterized protein n=1 Tax=Trichomalopsis sarcophagae TaxID=543379 RepID=A0A232FD67_9HYME|nr:hypothetical protein TSAR_013527 [Trichomalopsis sarcophagae]